MLSIKAIQGARNHMYVQHEINLEKIPNYAHTYSCIEIYSNYLWWELFDSDF